MKRKISHKINKAKNRPDFKRSPGQYNFDKDLDIKKYGWIVPLARKVKENSGILARFLAEILAKVAIISSNNPVLQNTKWRLIRNFSKTFIPVTDSMFSHFEKTVQAIESALGEMSADILRDSEVTSELISPLIETIASGIEANPQMIVILGNPAILEEIFGETGESIATIITIIPALSQRAHDALPNLREMLFDSLFQLPKPERDKLYKLAEEILGEVFKEYVFPRLEEILSIDPRGKVLAPILKGAVNAIPGESCLNAALSIACTHRYNLTIGRIIAIAIQELGGIYVKISQVIAELCPQSLAKELRTSQDDAGGLFPSEELSWNYLLEYLNRKECEYWKSISNIPDKPQRHFASASVGALYELELNEEGRKQLNRKTVLIKLQRPKLKELFQEQSNHMLSLCDESHSIIVNDTSLTEETRIDLLGIIAAIRRAVLNYYKQSSSELDFRQEKINALRVQEALKDNESIRIPEFYQAEEEFVVVDRMPGAKVTKIVQTKYLQRREIADTIIRAYLDLLFEHGVVWADPHPGNILYDDVTNQVSMIDLNPSFVWEVKTREHFKQLLYKLLLRDVQGVYETLYELVEDPESLHKNRLIDDLDKFLNTPLSAGSIMRFVGEFIKTLSENGIDLKVEVQAALRGLSQVALTANAVSVRNNFGLLLRRYFGIREIITAAIRVGIMRVFRVMTGLIFELTRRQPEEDVGPVLDERDLFALTHRVKELAKRGVCNIYFSRVSPDDMTTITIAADGSHLLITSDLHIDIIEKTRPATVKYVVDIPQRQWLKERQEFIKLASVARNFCVIECLEQLRRNSLDDYWRIVEAWNKPIQTRTVDEVRLIGEIKTAARRLYALRFVNIWEGQYVGIPKSAKRAWKQLLLMESYREDAEQKFLISMRQKFANVVFNNLAFSTLYRLKMLVIEARLWMLRRKIKNHKFFMHLLPMSTNELADLILFGLSRNYLSSAAKK